MKQSVVLLTALLLAPLPALHAAEKTKPNIVIILADDLGYGDLSCQGQQFFKTPNIDRMATEGVRFTQHYSGSAVCAPSRCSLMTGRDTGHSSIRGNGPNDLKPDPEDITIATLLRNAGYTTAMIGKSCVNGNTQNAAVPNQKGFDHFFGTTDHRDAHNRFPPFVYKNGKTVPLPENHGKTGDTYDLDLYTREALEFLDRQSPARPFFLLMSCPVPHTQVRAPADSVERARKEIGDAVLPFVKTPANREAAIQYAAMVIRLDDATGSILAMLKEKDLDQNTMGDSHERQRPSLRRWLRPPVSRIQRPASRREASPLRRRHPHSLHRPLATAHSAKPAITTCFRILGFPPHCLRPGWY